MHFNFGPARHSERRGTFITGLAIFNTLI